MRFLDFLDGFETAAAPSAASPSLSKMMEFASDAAFVAAKGSAATEGDFYKRIGTPDDVRIFMDAAWTSLASLATIAADNVTDAYSGQSILAQRLFS